MADKVVEAVRADLLARYAIGKVEYGHGLDASPDSLIERLNHLYEELLDGACYIKSATMILQEKIDPDHNRAQINRLHLPIAAGAAFALGILVTICALTIAGIM